MGDLARTHMFIFGKHLVGDWRSGVIYDQSLAYATDAGAPMRRLRAAPDLANGGKFTRYGELRLLCDVGVGLDGGPAEYSSQPVFVLSSTYPGVALNFNFTPNQYIAAASPPGAPASSQGLGPAAVSELEVWLDPAGFANPWSINASIVVTLSSGASWAFAVNLSGAADYGTAPVPFLAGSATFPPTVVSGVTYQIPNFSQSSGTGKSVTQFYVVLHSPAVDSDPQIVLQISNDGGRTWGGERATSLGKIGDYRRVVRWRRNGRSNNRAFRVICSAPVRVALIECDLDSHG